MIIYPTIELLGGRCVSLQRGVLGDALIWHVDPVQKAQGFASDGAKWMHVTDFDALQGKGGHGDLVLRIIREANIPVQLGGGMRTRETVERWIDAGAGRIVIGTWAAQEPRVVRELARLYPDQIVLAVDVKDGRVMVDGWRKSSAFAPAEFIALFEGAPFAAIIVTDVASDTGDAEAELGEISALAASTRTPVIASGVVRRADDISRLRYIGNISGAIVGRALFNRTIDLKEALALAQPRPEPVAGFI